MGYVSGADAAREKEGMTMATTQQSLVVGVDVGGTFTDLFVLDEHTGEARVIKVPSTRGEKREAS